MINKMSHTRLVLLLLAISYFLLMFGNDIVSLTHPDEVFYIQTAKEMITRNEWLTPYIFDAPQFEKPIFTYWLLIIAIKIFGLTPFASRFWPAAFGMIGVVATYALVILMFKNKRMAFVSSVILATSLIYVTLSRAVLTDMIFSIWVVLSLVLFHFGFCHRRFKDIGIILCCVFSGIAILTKGPLGLAFPCVIILAYLSYKRELSYLKTHATLWGLLLLVLIAVPWHALMIKWYGQIFTNEYFHNVHIRRIMEAEHQKSNTWYFYLMTMVVGIFPWSLFLIPAVWLIFTRLKKSHGDKDHIVFLLFWISCVVAMMQSAQSKLASYIFPVFPAIAVVMGYYFETLLKNEEEGLVKISRTLGCILAVFLFLGALGAIVFARKEIDLIVNLRPIYIFSILSLICSAALFLFSKKKQWVGMISSLASVIVIVLAFLFSGHSYAEPWVSCQLISNALKQKDASDSVILCSKFYVRGVRFYTDRKTAVIDINGEGFFSPHPIPFLNKDHEVRQFLNSHPVTYCIVKKGNVEDLQRITDGNFRIEHIEEIGGKYLLKISKSG